MCRVCLVLLDINHGPYCNSTSPNGMQQVFTASYIVHALNKYEFASTVPLGEWNDTDKFSLIHIFVG